jgi:hypothetical protein
MLLQRRVGCVLDDYLLCKAATNIVLNAVQLSSLGSNW